MRQKKCLKSLFVLLKERKAIFFFKDELQILTWEKTFLKFTESFMSIKKLSWPLSSGICMRIELNVSFSFFFTMGASLEDAKETGEGTKSGRALKGSSRRSASTFSCEERGEENGGVSDFDDPQGGE